MSTSRNALIGAMAAAALVYCGDPAHAACTAWGPKTAFQGGHVPVEGTANPTSKCRMLFNNSGTVVTEHSFISKPADHGELIQQGNVFYLKPNGYIGDIRFSIEIDGSQGGASGSAIYDYTMHIVPKVRPMSDNQSPFDNRKKMSLNKTPPSASPPVSELIRHMPKYSLTLG